MHRAFDRTARRTLQLSTLPALFKQAPHFEAQRVSIERFYRDSYWRFFGVTTAGASAAVTSDAPAARSLRALCTTLRRIEKQHER